jgi:hypothetical protein
MLCLVNVFMVFLWFNSDIDPLVAINVKNNFSFSSFTFTQISCQEVSVWYPWLYDRKLRGTVHFCSNIGHFGLVFAVFISHMAKILVKDKCAGCEKATKKPLRIILSKFVEVFNGILNDFKATYYLGGMWRVR